jgi:cytochrome c peroxidase
MTSPRRILALALGLCPLAALGCFEGNPAATRNAPVSAGSRTDTPPQAAGSVAPETRSANQGDVSQKARADTPVSVTPDRAVDPKSLIDVVKEEVKGGEASEGPTPLPYLWLPADPSLIKDEPIAIKPPLGFTEAAFNGKVPLSNPMTRGKVELGKQLYFDARVSKDGTVSCATCHNPEKGWTDNLPGSIGIKGQKGSRSAPTVLNTIYGLGMFWDGRAPSLEGQAQGPVQNKIEMGDQSYKEIIERLRTIPGYRDQFKKVFGTDVTLDGMAKAVAAFERTVLTGNSPYDRYDQGDSPESLKVLSDSAKRGMVLFGLRLRQDDEFKPGVTLKKANCTSCHAGANFSDEQFHNLGVGWDEKSHMFADLGRFVIAPIGGKNDSDIGSFKTPTVRDVTRTAPYMHDGSEKTLEEVVEYYNKGGNRNPHLDRDMKPLNLSAQEKADLVEFMKALAGEETQVALPTLPPGPDGKSPNPRAALTPPPPGHADIDEPHGVIGH